MIFRLDDRILFPDAGLAEPDGLLAIGGDLSVERLALAYKSGIFPWYSEDDPILWFSPHERFVLYPERLNVSKSMKRILRSGAFTITYDNCFNEVVKSCSTAPREGQDGTWITTDMQAAYSNLHDAGFAHSIEVWQNQRLVGGLYGVAIGTVFCGESMFSKVSNASKVALISLCQSSQYELIDCQVYTDHLASMGAHMITRQEYMAALHKTIA
ncbi:leucyl/phenylalanyl-tRNA--protein transferase [Inquilinus sp. KBS0705]|nr:leucyl/phenylalanyl-tRNA--protein transferase [Inquilinus sp. KBS0705]